MIETNKDMVTTRKEKTLYRNSGGKTLDEMLQQMEFKKRLAIAIE